MSNKKVLSQATKNLNKVNTPSKPRDIIYDPMGQWAHPGQPTRIPGGNITMQGVPYPVVAYPNVGQPQMMQPGQDYNFPEANYVDEYPQMKKGGLKKNKTSRSLMATNKLFAKHAFFKKPKKNVIFDPNSPNFQDGGFIEAELSDDEIQAYRDGGYVVEDISVPQLNTMDKGGASGCPPGHYYNGKKCVKIPKGAKVIKDPKEYEERKAAYNDSLNLYNTVAPAIAAVKEWQKSVKNKPFDKNRPVSTSINFNQHRQFPRNNINPISQLLNNESGTKGNVEVDIYKKPEQPVILGKKYPKEVVKKPSVKPKTIVAVKNQYPTGYDEPIVTPVPPGKIQVGTKEIQTLNEKTGKVTTVIEPVYEDAPIPERLPLLPPKLIDTSRAEVQGEYQEEPELVPPGFSHHEPSTYRLPVKPKYRGKLQNPSRYNPVAAMTQYLSGYEPLDEEEYVDVEGRIVPKGFTSLQDIGVQRRYNKAYDEYEAKQQEYEAKQQFAKAMAATYGLKKYGGPLNLMDNGGEPELEQDLQEQVVYGNEAKRKLQGSLIDKYAQAKRAYQDYRENAGLTKQRLKNEGASSIGVLQGQVKEYKNQLEEEKKTYDRAQKALNVLQKKDPENWKDKKLKDVMSSQGVDALRNLYKDGKMSDASFKDFYDNFGKQYDAKVKEGVGPGAEYSAKEAKDKWGKSKDWQDFTGMVNKAAVAAPLFGAAGAAGLALGTGTQAVLANPFVQAGLTGYGGYNAVTETIPEAYKNFKEGDYLKGAGNTAMAALEVVPGLGLAGKGAKALKNVGSNAFKSLATSGDDVSKLASNVSRNTSGTLNAGISPDLIKNAVGPSNKVAATLADEAYFAPFLNKTLNKISPLNYIPGYGKKLEGAVKPLGNVINKNIKNGNLVEQKGLIGKAKSLVGKGVDQPITTKLNRSNADIYSAKFDDAVQNSDIVLGDPMKQGVLGRTFNKKNALSPLQSKTTGNPLSQISLSDEGLSLNRRLPFSNRYVPIDKQKLLNNEFQWSTTGAGLQNVGEKFVKNSAFWGGLGAAGAAATYNPYDYIDESGQQVMRENNKTIEDVRRAGNYVPTRADAFIEGFNESINSPSEFLKNPDPYMLRTIGSAVGFKEGGYVDAELTDEEIDWYKSQGYTIVKL